MKLNLNMEHFKCIVMNSFKSFLYVIILLMFSFTTVKGAEANRYAQDSLRIGQDLPFFELITPDGEELASTSLKGKVVVLDFWATWCGPCKELTHQVNENISDLHKRSDFLMIGVNYREYKPDLAKKYWIDSGYKFPMAGDKDVLGKLISAGNPTLMVIDKKGKVRGRWDYFKPEVAIEAKLLINQLLSEKN